MRTLAVLQPSYLPWLGYFDQITRSDVFVIYDDVQFDKHGWRNRNRVKSPDGQPHWLTVPVKSKGKPLVRDALIDNTLPWQRKQLGTVRQFYSKAPFFHEIYPELEKHLAKPRTHLIDLNLDLIRWFCDDLRISHDIKLASELGISGEQSERLLNLSLHFKADHYLSGNAAQDYLDTEMFTKAGVKVVWQDYQHPIYPQINGPFEAYLSVLDLLLNVGANGAEHFVKKGD